MFRFNPRSRCNSSSRCCYRAREHVFLALAHTSILAESALNSTPWSTSTSDIFPWEIPQFCHNSSCSANPKANHSPRDSLVHLLQCGNAAAVFLPSLEGDFVSEVWRYGSIQLDAVSRTLDTTHTNIFFVRVLVCSHDIAGNICNVFMWYVALQAAAAQEQDASSLSRSSP